MKNDKLRDMVRSILPSVYRWPKRAKAVRKRAHRRAIRAELRHADEARDLLRDVYVGDLVLDRQAGHKLKHFMRWCESITEGMSEQEALSYVRAILPKNLIGDHAYSHWYFHVKYPPFPISIREYERRSVQSFHDRTTCRLRRALAEDPTLHHRLNEEIKRRKPIDQPRRLLLGVHDIEAFVDALNTPEFAMEKKILLTLCPGRRN